MVSVHLLTLIHGMWGNPSHLDEMRRVICETYPTAADGMELQVLLAETNQNESTYDGIDWGGVRVAKEVGLLSQLTCIDDFRLPTARFYLKLRNSRN